MRSPAVTIVEGMKWKKRIKLKIEVGYLVKANTGNMEDKTRNGRSKRMRKEVVGCVQDVLGKNNVPDQFEYEQKRYLGYISLLYLC